MKYASIEEWANAKVEGQKKSLGFSNYTVDFLVTNYVQSQLYEVARMSAFLTSAQQYIANKCHQESYLEKFRGQIEFTNVAFKNCRSEFDLESIKNMMEQLERVNLLANSMKFILQELKDLNELSLEATD